MKAERALLGDDQLAALGGVLADAGEAVAGPLTASPITGGRSNLTYQLDDGTHAWVLRMPPAHGRTPSAHDVSREYRVARALADTAVPVARAVTLVEDEGLLGAPYTILGFCSGTTIQTREQLDQLPDATVSMLCDELVRVLGAVHCVDVETVGLGGFGRPDGYAERQLKRWSGQWHLVGDPALAALATRVAYLLRAGLPEQRHTSLVHGDYRIDNTLLAFDERHPEQVTITAVVDWELSTLGDPVADVAMMCAYRDPAFDLVIGTPTAWTSPRLPGPNELAAAYERAGGVPLDHWKFHLGLARYKLAVIAAGIDHRHRASGGADASYATAGAAVEPFLTAALSDLEVSP